MQMQKYILCHTPSQKLQTGPAMAGWTGPTPMARVYIHKVYYSTYYTQKQVV